MTETVINNVGHHNPNGSNFLIQFNLDYFKTRDGILKLLQLVAGRLRCNFQLTPTLATYIRHNKFSNLLEESQQFIAIICMALASPAYKGSSHFFLFVVVINFIGTVLWSFVYFLGIKEALSLPINWILSEFVNNIISVMMYAAAFIIQMATWIGSNERNSGANITAGFFGLLNTLAYAASAYYLYLQHKFSQSN